VTDRLPHTDRYEAPLYLARYKERQARRSDAASAEVAPTGDDGVPLYLRRFRERRADPGLLDSPPAFNEKWAEVARSKEIVAPPEARIALAGMVRLVRHGETQGYSTDSGLTPLGKWQSHRRGFDVSKGVRDGDVVRLVCADTARARQTAEHLHRGLLDGLEQWGRRAEVVGPEPLAALDNFRVSTPSGVRDVTAAFREYHSVMERYERVGLGDRPLWLVEIDRFWRTQVGGGDPIHHWLTIPMLHFEPPVSCVRRYWGVIARLVEESPGALIVAPAHSGPIRAFATWAHGYDPGEPYNLEEVVVSVKEGGKEALVAYRNRVTEVHVPPMEELPDWRAIDEAVPAATH
jgi:broad specificity phosphatase PhoE